MGRKSQAKQTPKKNPSKEVNKFELQKRKDLSVLIEKLLKLTGIFPAAVTPAKSWEHHLEIEQVLKQIQNIELPKTKTENKPRGSNLEQFYKWLSDNGAEYDGVEISSFEGLDLGLKATKQFNEGSLILTIPRKVMMSESDAKNSELDAFIKIDPLMQNMPNITLALFLLLEKNKPDSFWKPYIDILPEKYSTILYFTSEELLQLKPSPVLESSLKLYRSIARQYAYFYNKIQSMTLPVMKDLREVFTYENYRWAVSTVMTRQNNINLSSDETTAFIPLWDMCNHQQGKITTDFNKEQSRGECYAVRDFAPGDQIYIFYGARPNSDLFLHNGFVYPENKHDSLSISLGVSSSDILRDKRVQLLGKLGLANVSHYTLHAGDTPISAELLAFIRIFNMNDEELTKWSEGMPGELVSSDQISADKVGAAIDKKAYNYLLIRCKLLRSAYGKEDMDTKEPSIHRHNVRLLNQCEIQILEDVIKYLDNILKQLQPETKST